MDSRCSKDSIDILFVILDAGIKRYRIYKIQLNSDSNFLFEFYLNLVSPHGVFL
jgi:hypothetical protein